MYDLEGYVTVRFDALDMELPVSEDWFIRFDRNCTPGKTIPCGNACRTPANCKSRGKARVSEKGKELRQSYADQIRAKRGLASRSEVNSAKRKSKASTPSGSFGSDRTTASEAALVESAMKKNNSPAARLRSLETKRGKALEDVITERMSKGKYNNPEFDRKSRAARAIEDEMAVMTRPAERKAKALEKQRRKLAKQSMKTRMTKGKYNPEYEDLNRKMAANEEQQSRLKKYRYPVYG